MTRTLFILPSAIGDVIEGRGVAHRLLADGPVTWVVNALAAPAVSDMGLAMIHPPSPRIRRMAGFGAATETLQAVTEEFLGGLAASGPYERVVQVHLSRAAALMSGIIPLPKGRGLRRGPALGTTPALPEGLVSDAWSDFFLGSIHHGFSPELASAARFSLVAGLSEPAFPEDVPGPASSAAAGPILLCPMAGWPSKALGIDQAAGIADALAGLGDVELLGAPDERDVLLAIVERQKSRRAAIRTGPLRDALEAVRQARLVVTADSWPLHAATAAARPVLALLGSTRVFARGPAAASLAPDRPANWKPSGDRTVEEVDVGSVAEVAQGLLEGNLEQARVRGCLRLWAGGDRERHPLPNRPAPAAAREDERAVQSWIRAQAFSTIVGREHPGAPSLPLRPASDLPLLYEDLPGAVTRVEAGLRAGTGDFLDSFVLFPTTFPDRDPERILSAWMKAAAEALQSLKD